MTLAKPHVTMRIVLVFLSLIFTSGCDRKEAAVPQGYDIEAQFEKAYNHLATLTQAHQDGWGLGTSDRWDVDMDAGTITWTFADGTIVTAPMQVVGTYNALDNTFLWGWDHPSVSEPLSRDAKAVLDFARKHDIDFLQNAKIECSEQDVWDYVALATLLCDRQGAYRGPADSTYLFMTFDKVSIQKKPE